MKRLILIPFLISQLAVAECDVKSASLLANEHKVGPIQHLTKNKVDNGSSGTCMVKFDIEIDDETYFLEESETGLEQLESLCYYAQERARKDLLLQLGGQFKSESVTTCRDGDTPPPKIKKGDTILADEVGPHPVTKEFKYKGAKCRMFQQHYVVDRKLREYGGVICQVDNSDTNWLVVDKW
jgi:hypothetical protein